MMQANRCFTGTLTVKKNDFERQKKMTLDRHDDEIRQIDGSAAISTPGSFHHCLYRTKLRRNGEMDVRHDYKSHFF